MNGNDKSLIDLLSQLSESGLGQSVILIIVLIVIWQLTKDFLFKLLDKFGGLNSSSDRANEISLMEDRIKSLEKSEKECAERMKELEILEEKLAFLEGIVSELTEIVNDYPRRG